MDGEVEVEYAKCDICQLTFALKDMQCTKAAGCGPLCNYCFGEIMNPEWDVFDG